MASRPPLTGTRPPAFLSKASLAAELDISESTVDEWVRRGLLPRPIRLSGSVRWSWVHVCAALHPEVEQEADPFMTGLGNVA